MTLAVTAQQLHDVLAGASAIFLHTARGPLSSTSKPDGTVVTRVDTAVNEWLRPALTSLFPEAAWLSEESRDDPARLEAEWAWVVDPVDGTKELARGIPECAISVGLVHADAVIAGGVVNPFGATGAATGTDGSWLAWPAAAGGKAAPQPTDTSVSRTETEDHSIAPFADLLVPLRSIGSVANKLLRVALRLDRMTVSVRPKSEWDLCGGVALLQSRDMVLRRLDGAALRFNQPNTLIPGGFVAGTPADVAARLSQIRARREPRAPS